MVERRAGIKRPEKEEQFVLIAEIAEQKRPLFSGDKEFSRKYGYGGEGLSHAVMLAAKEEGISTAFVFGYFLKKDREEAGLTQKELGEKVEELGLGRRIHPSVICLFERGERLGEQFPSKKLLSVVAALDAPDYTFWALMDHYEYTSPETGTFIFKLFGKILLQRLLRLKFIPVDAAGLKIEPRVLHNIK